MRFSVFFSRSILTLTVLFGSLQSVYAKATLPQAEKTPETLKEQTKQADPNHEIEHLCKDLSNKLRTIDYQGCLSLHLHVSDYSVKQKPLTTREILPNSDIPPKGKILFIGGIHGDEYAAISITYLWLQALMKPENKTPYHWLFLPVANPDGLLQKNSTRINAHGVDLNRNFPSPDWEKLALKSWKNHTHSNPRRYPGPTANSEPETQWIVKIIKAFQPDAIISIHAPYGLLDYDGPEHAQPNKIGHLKRRELGTYPGSLGRYAGEYLNIPVLTLELTSAGRMPNASEIHNMLEDLEEWVNDKIKQREEDM
ncbi:MAG: succinylglutamate desuccinylase/aspartoacylase family protein [Thiotrichales bacterium]|nr:succinylglutamate desuccinylase/aspartoacylase family protein [Thiotrichales bacterium]